MTVSSTINRVDYTGNGASDTYNYTFKIFSDSDLLVTVRNPDTNVESTLALTTDYTVSGTGDAAGGSIALVDINQSWLDAEGDLKTGWIITIRRVRDIVQETDIRNQGDFFPEIHEDAFDHFIMVDQQQQDSIDRSIRLPETFSSDDVSTVLPAPSAGNVIGWNSSADALTNLAGIGSLEVSSLGETLINAATPEEARTILDVSQAIESLPAETSPAVGDLMAINDISEGADNQITLQNMLKVVNVLTEDTSAASNDFILSYDTSASLPKKVTLSNIRGTTTRSVTTTDAAAATDETLILSGSSFTETLFTAVGNAGRKLTLIHAGTSLTHLYTIDGNGSETIGGALTTILNMNGEILELLSDGANWIVLRRYIPSVWTAYTPAFQGLGTVSSILAYYKRTGDSINVVARFTTGTTTSVNLQIGLPGGVTVDSNKWASGNTPVGRLMRHVADPTSPKGFVVKANAGNAFLTLGLDDYTSTVNPANDSLGPVLGSNEAQSMYAVNIPITGWAG